MLPVAFSSKEQFVDTYGCYMSRMFPNSHHEPHKLTFSILDCLVTEMFPINMNSY